MHFFIHEVDSSAVEQSNGKVSSATRSKQYIQGLLNIYFFGPKYQNASVSIIYVHINSAALRTQREAKYRVTPNARLYILYVYQFISR